MHKDYTHKLGLGTVQFGLEYGISNTHGQTSLDEVKDILKCAADHNITTIDTAHLYGNSEEAIGQSLPSNHDFKIVTKTIPIKKDTISEEDITTVKTGIDESLNRLQQKQLDGLLLHHSDDLKSKNAGTLYEALVEYKSKGIINKIGISAYNSEQIDFTLENFDIDLIQIPMNIFDQRLLTSGTLKKLKQKNIEIHVRSAFLQGVIFMQPKQLPSTLKPLAPYLQKFLDLAQELNQPPEAVALAFLIQQEEIDKIICGINSCEQFQTLITHTGNLPAINPELFNSFAINDTPLINPANW